LSSVVGGAEESGKVGRVGRVGREGAERKVEELEYERDIAKKRKRKKK
jgi:hypothetical protein